MEVIFFEFKGTFWFRPFQIKGMIFHLPLTSCPRFNDSFKLTLRIHWFWNSCVDISLLNIFERSWSITKHWTIFVVLSKVKSCCSSHPIWNLVTIFSKVGRGIRWANQILSALNRDFRVIASCIITKTCFKEIVLPRPWSDSHSRVLHLLSNFIFIWGHSIKLLAIFTSIFIFDWSQLHNFYNKDGKIQNSWSYRLRFFWICLLSL